MGVDGKGRFIVVGGVIQTIYAGERTNSQSKKVFVGTPDSAGKIVWAEGASLGVARTAMGFTSFKGRQYIVAGQPDPPRPNEIATNSVLVGSTDSVGRLTWAPAPDLPDSPPQNLPFGVAVTVASAGGKDRIYVIGGLERTSATAEPRSRVWKADLDPATGMPTFWSAAKPMPEGRAYNQAYQNTTGQLVVVGGLGPGPKTTRVTFSASIEGISGELNWQTVTSDLPLPLQNFGFALWNGIAILSGGSHIGFTEISNEILKLAPGS